MSPEFSQIPDLEIIELTVEGLIDQTRREKILLGAVIQLNMAGYVRLLIDVINTKYAPNRVMTDALSTTMFMKKINFPPQTRMAVLYEHEKKHRKHFETIARFAGFKVKYFKNRDKAIEWLCQN